MRAYPTAAVPPCNHVGRIGSDRGKNATNELKQAQRSGAGPDSRPDGDRAGSTRAGGDRRQDGMKARATFGAATPGRRVLYSTARTLAPPPRRRRGPHATPARARWSTAPAEKE